jgi:hypothetical protein
VELKLIENTGRELSTGKLFKTSKALEIIQSHSESRSEAEEIAGEG